MTLARTPEPWLCHAPPANERLDALADTLARRLRLPSLVARLLALRGHDDPDKASRFLDPKLTDLHDPMRLSGMALAARRLVKAVRDRQPIVVYGDYDVDGVTASAILHHTLTLAGGQVRAYVPHRIEEGYGLNSQAIATLCQELTPGPAGGVIVSVDCGVTACEPAAIAKAHGVDLIITDHHHFDAAQLPDALAIVHPGLPGDDGQPYPFADLCGAGVAMKLAWAVAREHCGSSRLPAPFRALLLDLMSLAALGTVADVVPLLGENRIIASYGLKGIKHTAIAGLNAMIDAASLRDEKIDAYHVGFVLGPRLNACGRMGHASHAVELLTTAQGDDARRIAQFLTHENRLRQETQQQVVDEAMEQVARHGYDHPDRRAIVVASPDWHPGVVGIVASRLVEAFRRPAIVLSLDGLGHAHGSARSVEAVSIHDALTHCADCLDRFGGHAMAAGMHLPADRIDALRDALVAYVNERLSPQDLRPAIHADADCTLADLTPDTLRQLQRLAPFGKDNPEPTLRLANVRVIQPARRMGTTGKHLSLVVSDGQAAMRVVGFNLGDCAPALPAGVSLNLIGQPKLATWQGSDPRVELILKAPPEKATLP